MKGDRRRVRSLLVAVFVPVVIVIGVLASAVLGDGGTDRPTALPTPALTPTPASAPAPIAPQTTTAPVAPAPPAPPAAAAAPEPTPPEPEEPGLTPEPEQDSDPPFSTEWVPDGARRIDVGGGAQAAAVFVPLDRAGAPGPVVILLHGWVALDPHRYGPWIAHLVRGGASVIFPAYQTKPAYDTISPLSNVLAGVRLALPHVDLAPGRLVVAGHSAGGALAADYAAVAAANGLPEPAAVFSVYPGRRLRHLAVPIPTADLSAIPRGTRLLAFAGERDTAVGSGPARRIVALATQADATLRTIRDDAVDMHSAPRSFDGAAQRTFWAPLDELVAATASPSGSPDTP